MGQSKSLLFLPSICKIVLFLMECRGVGSRKSKDKTGLGAAHELGVFIR